ncbi:hypothetical protein BC938DRAFT_480164 [Jimgerdemannia flammicorona]|uniref:Uncharacterized protein n=1 Tax=Jimgerdemannia flammicorona TaxID=994334 RepID=A0A433QXF5_9FUNG|nr:hypothetical protein BC938DRAFT_480164 [Jimgerdemannia flammicorona]
MADKSLLFERDGAVWEPRRLDRISAPFATYVLAPLPNALCAKCAGGDDIMSDHYSFPVDMGHFLTGIFFITGLCMYMLKFCLRFA